MAQITVSDKVDSNLDINALHAKMTEISELVPISEIFYIIDEICIKGQGMSREMAFSPENINRAGKMFLQNRLVNQVCHGCGKYARQGFRKVIPIGYPTLYECGKCKMTYYCSKDCHEKDLPIHNTWCCNISSPRDMGFNKTVIINLNTGKTI